MKIAAAYIRVSTDDQLEYSPDSQLVQIRRYAKANGFTLPEEYIFIEEEGRSGRYSVKRPEFLQMISTAKKKPKPFDAILVWKLFPFCPQPSGQHHLQVYVAQGTGNRGHLDQRKSG